MDDTPIAIGDTLYSPIFGKVIVKGIRGLKPNERAGYINITLYKWGIHFKTGSIFYSKGLHMVHLERKRLSVYGNIMYIVGEADDCTGLSPRLHTLSQIILFSMAVAVLLFMLICMGIILNFLGI